MEDNNITPHIRESLKARLYEMDTYDIIRPYNINKEIFDLKRFDVEIIKKGNKKLVIIREKNGDSK